MKGLFKMGASNSDTKPVQDGRDATQDAAPIDNQSAADFVTPHQVDEDAEALMGEVIPDPWADPAQQDWPDNEDETDDKENV